MVAAAKLRRAQEAAEAARPYSQRMAAVLSNIAEAVGSGDDAPKLMTGTGKDDVHLLVVCTAERGSVRRLQLVRSPGLPAIMCASCWPTARRSRSCAVGKKGYDILRREYASMIIDRVDFREVKKIGFARPKRSARRSSSLFEQGEFDVCTLFYSEFKSVISADPDRAAADPGLDRLERKARQTHRRSTNTSRSAEEILEDLLPRNIKVQIFRALLENAASERARKCPPWTTRRAMPAR
jgi:F-type H+-transporting ATPase subunit gamma